MEPAVETTEALSAIEAQTRAEIDTQVRTAKAFPRSVKTFMQDCTTLATLNEDVAASCIYALPRGGKSIEGPSARLAEIIMSSWGNCRAGARVIEVGEKEVVAQAVFRDVERNTTVTFEVRRRITDRYGKRYNDDMITVTGNAACSIAFRNVVFRGVPKAYWDPIYQAARHASIGDVKTIENRRAEMVGYFQKMGVTETQILDTLGKSGIEDIGQEELIQLRGLATALKDGDTTIEETFGKKARVKAPRKTASSKEITDEIKSGQEDLGLENA